RVLRGMLALAFCARAKFDFSKEDISKEMAGCLQLRGPFRRLTHMEEAMKFTHLSITSKPAAAITLATALFAGGLVALAPATVKGDVEKKGTAPYVTHFVFRPLISLDVGELGKATTLEAVGTTENMKGEKMLDKMS